MLKKYEIGELRRVVNESEVVKTKQEFKPLVFGSNETKEINKKAYSDIEKETEAYNGGIKNEATKGESELSARNGKGMQDLRFDNAPDSYKERVGAQMKGYASKEAEKLHSGDTPGNYDNSGNKEMYKVMGDEAEESKDKRTSATTIGLTGRELPKKEVENLRDTMFESNNKMKRFSFKTKFINEEHVLSRVPDDMKVEGKRFIMRGSDMTEYLVEWSGDSPKVTKKLNMNLVNEEKDRIKRLWEYKSREHEVRTNNKLRVQENTEFTNVLDKVRNLMK